MAKAAAPKPEAQPAKAAQDVFSIGQMPDPAEMLEQFRSLAEENLAKSKAAMEKAKATFDAVQKEAEAGLHSAQENSSKISLAAIDTMRANTESTFSHLEKMVGIKSVAEMIELQTAFVREQAEKAVDTAKTMQGLYQKAGEDLTAPAKAVAEKAMGALKQD
ncbi:MAG: phasin family protein [Roseitalea sp.]|nr:phasin family protein [Roseitalea sp.]MBO6723661.1 phasin family protein [Roseitalea sp.]MBO6744450.1 phasin family protein [Roseitalea sp.]